MNPERVGICPCIDPTTPQLLEHSKNSLVPRGQTTYFLFCGGKSIWTTSQATLVLAPSDVLIVMSTAHVHRDSRMRFKVRYSITASYLTYFFIAKDLNLIRWTAKSTVAFTFVHQSMYSHR